MTLPATSIVRHKADRRPVVMVVPPSTFLLDERVFMSLGILKVAAVLEADDYRIEMLDLSGIENYEAALEDHLRRTDAFAVCLTATTPQMPAAVRVAEIARRLRPDMRLVIGGPHATLVNAAQKLEAKDGRRARGHAALEDLHRLFDVVVSGDGESAVFEALSTSPPKLVDADDPKSHLWLTNARYEEAPMPARHLLDVESYHYGIEGRPSTSLIAQLGCPYQCTFCGGRNSPMLRRIRMRSTASIVAEVESLHRRWGYTGFMFYDDELNVSKSMVELMDAIADLQKRLGVEFRLRGFVKSNLFTEEQARAMRRAGFRWLLCGFEAASPRILENINKRATLEDNTRVMEIAHANGLKVKALMSIGHAGETEESVRSVRDWLIDVKPADFDCTIISTYPGTPYYDEALPHPELDGVWTYTSPRTGDRLHAFDIDYTRTADYYKGAPGGGYVSHVFTDHLTPGRIVELRDQLESEVRETLGIPFNPGAPGVRYEHAMGMSELPPFILRRTP